MSAKKTNEPGFEADVERLEKIVEAMESGRLNLDEMLAHFEEGNRLVKRCSIKLNEVEQKIEILVKKGEQIEAEGFEPPAEPETENKDSDDEN